MHLHEIKNGVLGWQATRLAVEKIVLQATWSSRLTAFVRLCSLLTFLLFPCAAVPEKQVQKREPNKPNKWLAAGEADMEETEILWLALALNLKGFDTLKAQQSWYDKLLEDQSRALELRGAWRPLTSGEGAWPKKGTASTAFDPFENAFSAQCTRQTISLIIRYTLIVETPNSTIKHCKANSALLAFLRCESRCE